MRTWFVTMRCSETVHRVKEIIDIIKKATDFLHVLPRPGRDATTISTPMSVPLRKLKLFLGQ